MWYRFDVSWKKIVVFIAQSGLKLYDFNIVDGELKRTQNVVVPGSEAADGMWQKNMLTMNQTTGKAIIQLILHYVLFIWTFGAAWTQSYIDCR